MGSIGLTSAECLSLWIVQYLCGFQSEGFYSLLMCINLPWSWSDAASSACRASVLLSSMECLGAGSIRAPAGVCPCQHPPSAGTTVRAGQSSSSSLPFYALSPESKKSKHESSLDYLISGPDHKLFHNFLKNLNTWASCPDTPVRKCVIHLREMLSFGIPKDAKGYHKKCFPWP